MGISDAAFSVNGEYEMTGEGDAFRILATVVKIITEFMDNHPEIKSIIFSSTNAEPSKLRVYARLVKKYAAGYHVKQSGLTFRLLRS